MAAWPHTSLKLPSLTATWNLGCTLGPSSTAGTRLSSMLYTWHHHLQSAVSNNISSP